MASGGRLILSKMMLCTIDDAVQPDDGTLLFLYTIIYHEL
jgi:hypothetical protein